MCERAERDTERDGERRVGGRYDSDSVEDAWLHRRLGPGLREIEQGLQAPVGRGAGRGDCRDRAAEHQPHVDQKPTPSRDALRPGQPVGPAFDLGCHQRSAEEHPQQRRGDDHERRDREDQSGRPDLHAAAGVARKDDAGRDEQRTAPARAVTCAERSCWWSADAGRVRRSRGTGSRRRIATIDEGR